MSKSLIIDQFLELNINKEKEILSKMKSNFIINIFCSFQDFSNLYLVLQLMSGGDLRYHLYHYSKPFTEDMIKFIIINISLCLQYIHKKGIIHRDIKPENFVFDEKGYLHLTDFGLAIYENENKNNEENILIEDIDDNVKEDYIENDLVGTLGYIAPEIILNTNKESFISDIFSFGIICYELIFRKRPYKGKTRYLIGKEMLNDEISYKSNIKYSDSLFNLTKKLLVINPEERLGAKSGIKEILENEYLKYFDYKEIQNHSYKSPFEEIIHILRENNNKVDNYFELFDIYECNKSFEFDEETNMRLLDIEANQDYILHFREYSYISSEIEEIISLNENTNYLDFQESETDEKIPKIKEKKLYRSNSDLTEYSYSSYNTYSSKNEIILPEINPKLLRNIYKYKYIKYKLLLNKYNKKNKIISKNEDEKKNNDKIKDENKEKNKDINKDKSKNKEKIKRKKSYSSYSSRTDDISYSDGKKLILNNYFMPNGNNLLKRNPLCQTPFCSVKNNFILPKINPFLRGFNNCYQHPNYMRNIRSENNRYSRCSSSDTYENLKKNIKYKLKGTNDSSEDKIFINKENSHKSESKNGNNKDINKSKIKKSDENKHKKYKLKVNQKENIKRMEEKVDKEIKNDKNDKNEKNENEKDKKKNKKIKKIKNGSKEKGKKNDKTKEIKETKNKKNINKKKKKTTDSDSKEKKITNNDEENEDEEEESEELTVISEKSEESEKESSEDNKNSENNNEEGENEDEDEDDDNNEKNLEETSKEEDD